jgi:hypothetical protein
MSFDERLRALVRGDSCVLRPQTYFVAWNGVLTLVYDGFPPVLAGIKARLNEEDGLPPENFGSRWPKTTLAALHDDAPPLSLAELTSLRALCDEYASKLSLRVPVSSLSFVSYDQRGLESVRERSDVALGSAVDDSEPSDAEQARVRGVLDEWSDLEAYLPRVNAPGSRIGSYRESSPQGSTLVAFIGASELRELVAQFRSAVDALLPGRYAWLDDASLHCTVRALG